MQPLPSRRRGRAREEHARGIGLTEVVRFAFAIAMPTRNQLLTERYLGAAGVAAVTIDAAGTIGAANIVTIALRQGMVAFCCQAADIARLVALSRGLRGPQAAVAAQLDELAAERSSASRPTPSLPSGPLRPSKRSMTRSVGCRVTARFAT